MIKGFEKLSVSEINTLIKAPVLVSLLASSIDHDISKNEKEDAVEMSHLRTFTADPILRPYYAEVEKHFMENFQRALAIYSPFDDSHRAILKKDIADANSIMEKLDKTLRQTLHRSLATYAAHVRKSNRSMLETFIFPFPVSGVTD